MKKHHDDIHFRNKIIRTMLIHNWILNFNFHYFHYLDYISDIQSKLSTNQQYLVIFSTNMGNL